MKRRSQLWNWQRQQESVGLTVEMDEKVATLLLKAYTDREMADELGIALRTVKAHMNRMFRRHGIRDGIKRIKLAVILYQNRSATDQIAA